MQNTMVPICTENRLLTSDFAIEPSLVGATLEFEFKTYRVRVAVPPERYIPIEPGQGERLTYSGYRVMDNKKVPVWFDVHDIDILVCSSDEVSVPGEVLNRNANAYEIISEPKQRQLNDFAKRNRAVGEEAFDLCLRTLRWKSDNGAIGRNTVKKHASGWPTRLVDPVTLKSIWLQVDPLIVPAVKPVKAAVWNFVEEALQNNLEPPISIDLMFDGIEHLKLGDFKRATIDFAVSCESFLRVLAADNLPSSLSNAIREFIDEANIRPVMNKFVPEILNEEDKKLMKRLEKILNKLFDRRNKIIHKGLQKDLVYDECKVYLEATRRLLSMRYSEIDIEPGSAI